MFLILMVKAVADVVDASYCYGGCCCFMSTTHHK
jgi:hypothetical protein